jgi:hypothetical protein
MKYLLPKILFCNLILCLKSYAQIEVKGVIVSSRRDPLVHATITIRDSIQNANLAFALSKTDGTFSIKLKFRQAGDYILIAEHINASVKKINFSIKSENDNIELGEIALKDSIRELQDVVIKSVPLPFSIRGDTIEFKAKSYKTPESRKVEDLLRNIQGFELSNDGKISFNGKEVDRILIEGEDLTEKNYQLLSRNLNANLVDKVQVINNFSTDRLVKEVEKSDKIGINLTIDNAFKNKLSGSIEVGSGLGGREYFDNNLILINKKLKLLSFINYNETGVPANSNLAYYYNQDEKEGIVITGEQDLNKLIQTGNIFLPQLGQAYTLDNKDLTGFLIGSWKQGKYVKMKVLTGTSRSILDKQSNGLNQFKPADGDSWLILQNERFRSTIDERIVKFSFNHDRQKNNTGNYTADILLKRAKIRYENLSFGAITDTLDEQLNNNGLQYRIAGNETFRLSKGRVLKVSMNLIKEDLIQNFRSKTNRYQDFFKLDSNFREFGQSIQGDLSTQEIDFRFLGPVKKGRWSAGIKMLHELAVYQAASNAANPETQSIINLGQAPSRFNLFKTYAYGILNKAILKKGEFSVGGSAGFGSVKIKQDYKKDMHIAPVLRGGLLYRYAISPVKNISMQYSFSSQLPERIYFHPLYLLSGQATILNPAEQLVNRRNHLISLSYATHNLIKNSGFVFYTSFSHTDGALSYSSIRTPSYGFLYYLSQNGNKLWSANLKSDKYIRRIRTKISIQLSAVFSASDLLFNEVLSRNSMSNFSIQPKLVTGFKFPLNMEASITAMYLQNKTIPKAGIINQFNLWQYQGYGKIKVRAGENFFLALMYNYYLLAPGSFFNTMDLFANFSLNKSWTFSATIHNLFNASSIVQRQFSVNSVFEQRYELVDRYLMIKAQWIF